MNNDRLDTIKNLHKNGEDFHQFDINWLIERAEKYQKLHEAWFKGIEEKEDTIFFLRKCKEIIEDIKIPTRKTMS